MSSLKFKVIASTMFTRKWHSAVLQSYPHPYPDTIEVVCTDLTKEEALAMEKFLNYAEKMKGYK